MVSEKNKSIILIQGDCRQEIKKIPDSSIDLILTDPPYGIGYSEWDDSSIFFGLQDELYRVLKPNKFFVFWWSIKKIPEISKIGKFGYVWQIIAQFPSSFSKSRLGSRRYTPIFVFEKGTAKVSFRRTDFVTCAELPVVEKLMGSGEFKPTIALSQLLLRFTKKGDVVLDPFMGSGGLGLVCRLFSRRYIGIENKENSFKVAEKIIGEMEIRQSLPEMFESLGGIDRKQLNLF